jgi:hypothetical protein
VTVNHGRRAAGLPVEQVPHPRRDAADAVEVAHLELAARLHVERCAGPVAGDAVKSWRLERDPGLVLDGEQVQTAFVEPHERRR